MGSTRTYSGCLNMAASHLSPITCFWATMLTEANSHWKPFASCWPTKSSTQRTFSSCEATMSVHLSTGYMVSLMNVSTKENGYFSCNRKPSLLGFYSSMGLFLLCIVFHPIKGMSF